MIVEKLNGELKMKSEYNVGSKFSFSFKVPPILDSSVILTIFYMFVAFSKPRELCEQQLIKAQ
jgi:hypothetical protein